LRNHRPNSSPILPKKKLFSLQTRSLKRISFIEKEREKERMKERKREERMKKTKRERV